MRDIRDEIDRLLDLPAEDARREGMGVVAEFRAGLNRGDYRAAEKIGGVWQTHAWVKRGILLAFRIGTNAEHSLSDQLWFRDKDTLPTRESAGQDFRVVPGGSSIRDGVYVGSSVICMPPMFINIGAWIGDGSMIDSHALVGSCAQIGRGVHLSAAAQIGGVLEPPGALPVIVEDEVFIGGNCGVYEGVIVAERAVLAPGVLLTGGVTVYDIVKEKSYRRSANSVLMIPPGAVLVPGTRPVKGGFGEAHGLSLYAPIVVKYRDERTDAATLLEETLR
jgi:2,3,4,5-tetrahydropyridine-2-carboxylate N-succinyltransferase